MFRENFRGQGGTRSATWKAIFMRKERKAKHVSFELKNCGIGIATGSNESKGAYQVSQVSYREAKESFHDKEKRLYRYETWQGCLTAT